MTTEEFKRKRAARHPQCECQRVQPSDARRPTFAYKGKSVKVKQGGEELGVRYVLEGSVRSSGDRV